MRNVSESNGIDQSDLLNRVSLAKVLEDGRKAGGTRRIRRSQGRAGQIETSKRAAGDAMIGGLASVDGVATEARS